MPNRFKASHVGLLLMLAVAWLVYRPGLSGPFLFDDFANLPSLGAGGPVTDWPAFERYVTSGNADPTGRPIALATFLIDARDWPANPRPFKRTNVLLHLFNAVLLFLLLVRLGQKLAGNNGNSYRRAPLAALVATSIWLLHPLFVSTTLYVVQREAMLPATFVLLGLLGWLQGRDMILRGALRSGFFFGYASLAAGTLFGFLSKANGILLPAFVLVIEFSLLKRVAPIRTRDGVAAHRRLLLGCLLVSASVAAGLIFIGAKGIVDGIGSQRPWTLAERLITEPRVLWDYLRLLWLPRPFTASLFNDQFTASTSLLHPWTTLPAIAGIIGLFASAIMLGSRLPALSTAILFFLVGHTIESTTIPLEIYFEHRNYVPALLVFWPFALWLVGVKSSSKIPMKIRMIIGAGIICGLTWMTHANATLWGDSQQQARLWAALNPTSPRAQVNAAQADIQRGRPIEAIKRLDPLLHDHPDEVQIALNLVAARCAQGSVGSADLARARVALYTARDPGTLLVSWFGRAMQNATNHSCDGLNLNGLKSLADAGAANPHFPDGRRQDMYHIRGMIALQRHNPEAALSEFDRALAFDVKPGTALEQAAALGSAGYPTEGLRHLTTFDALNAARPQLGMPMLHAWVLQSQNYWSRERAGLEHTLRHDIEGGGSQP